MEPAKVSSAPARVAHRHHRGNCNARTQAWPPTARRRRIASWRRRTAGLAGADLFPIGYAFRVTSTWAALADPHRREALEALRMRPRTAGELVSLLRLSQPGTSKHLRVLREAGLVDVRSEGRTRVYALAPAPLAELDAFLAPYRRLWSTRLDALERHLDARTEQA
jgi:DNA-binding transcriptional ArsR family regulator